MELIKSLFPRKRKIELGKHSQDLGWLLSEGRIAELVRQGRVPVRTGTIKSLPSPSLEEGEVLYTYDIPPEGFDPEDVEEISNYMGVTAFKYKDGTVRMATNFSIPEYIATVVDDRIAAARQEV